MHSEAILPNARTALQWAAVRGSEPQCMAIHSNAKQRLATQLNKLQCKAFTNKGQGNAAQCNATQCKATQCNAMQSKACQCNARQSTAMTWQCAAMQGKARQG
eukprot:845215-Pyramimonas_sp.AAC.1